MRKKDGVKQFNVSMFLNSYRQQVQLCFTGKSTELKAIENPKMVWIQTVNDDMAAAEASEPKNALIMRDSAFTRLSGKDNWV